MALLKFIRGNLMECQRKVFKILLNQTAILLQLPTFVDHHSLPDINFNGQCLIKNISILKKIINLFISYTLGPQLRNFNTDNYLLKIQIEINTSILVIA